MPDKQPSNTGISIDFAAAGQFIRGLGAGMLLILIGAILMVLGIVSDFAGVVVIADPELRKMAMAMGFILVGVGAWFTWVKADKADRSKRQTQQDKRFERMERKLDVILHELFPNGNSSMRDAIDRMELRQTQMDQRTQCLFTDLDKPGFEADAKGNWYLVNAAFAKLVNRSRDALLGNGWMNTVQDGAQRQVFAAWQAAIEQKRNFELEIPLVKPNGEVQRRHCKAQRMVGANNETLGYLGTLSPIEEAAYG